jgi:hypothetical protein
MPKSRKVELFVPAPVEQVERALKEQTRSAWTPSLATVWGGGDQRFKGKVEGARFILAPNERSFVRRMHSTARGELTASEGGTRVVAEVGISPAVTWLYRLSVIWGALVVAGVTGSLLLQEPSIVLVWMAIAIVALIGGTGWAVAKAETEIEGIVAALESTVMAASSPQLTSEEAESLGEQLDALEKKRRAAQKTER